MKDVHERFRYSPGVKAGPLLFMAGQLGRDEHLNVVEDKEAQFAQAFENVEKILSAAGATFDDVVDMATYHTDMRDLQLFIEVKDSNCLITDVSALAGHIVRASNGFQPSTGTSTSSPSGQAADRPWVVRCARRPCSRTRWANSSSM
jgi:enamine deaminase RidA (YjgF/YER057c/UK114 family)